MLEEAERLGVLVVGEEDILIVRRCVCVSVCRAGAYMAVAESEER